MQGAPKVTADKIQVLVWWVIWAAVLNGLVVIYFFLGRGPVEPAVKGEDLINLIGLGPLCASIVIRWLVLPRFKDLKRALPIYIAGLALAESCGFIGIFLGGPYRDGLFLLSALGVIQFIPLFVGILQPPKNAGFDRR